MRSTESNNIENHSTTDSSDSRFLRSLQNWMASPEWPSGVLPVSWIENKPNWPDAN